MGKINVLVADDHYLSVRGIESILLEDEMIEIVGIAHNGKEAYEMAVRLRPDLVLMDVNMPVMSGLQALKLIIKEHPQTKVFMLTGEDHENQLTEALILGAKGFLIKNFLPEELLTFVHMAARGESIITSQMTGKIINNLLEQLRIHNKGSRIERSVRSDVLTRREKEILAEVMKGLTNREIAEVLYISENTVKNHLRNIMEKLHMNNRVQAAAFALKEGLL